MAIAQTRCPNCHQLVEADAQVCSHCGVYLQLPVQHLPEMTHTPAPITSSPAILSPMAPLPPVATVQSLPDAVKQLDSAASTHLTISGVLIAFYASAIFAGKVTANPYSAIVYALPVLLLLITVILSVRVFYPGGYLTDDYPTLLRIKDARLRHSSLLLEISVGVLAVAVFVYLIRTP